MTFGDFVESIVETPICCELKQELDKWYDFYSKNSEKSMHYLKILLRRGSVNGNLLMLLPLFVETYERRMNKMTYGEIYNEFCKKFPNVEVEDYRPAVKMHILQLSRDIPNAIIVWIKDGSKVIYMTESEE